MARSGRNELKGAERYYEVNGQRVRERGEHSWRIVRRQSNRIYGEERALEESFHSEDSKAKLGSDGVSHLWPLCLLVTRNWQLRVKNAGASPPENDRIEETNNQRTWSKEESAGGDSLRKCSLHPGTCLLA